MCQKSVKYNVVIRAEISLIDDYGISHEAL